MNLDKMKQRLIAAGRLRNERDIELFDALSEHAPELLAFAFAASLAGVQVTEQEPDQRDD